MGDEFDNFMCACTTDESGNWVQLAGSVATSGIENDLTVAEITYEKGAC